mmetsp:Transcript_19104/g.56725  ORF Transcript_19104/g.56725 Transcript_19104/m.56725 type:complete len:188 (+) Transcript_19104:168-731(+)
MPELAGLLLLLLTTNALRPASTARRRKQTSMWHHLTIDLDACLALDALDCPELAPTAAHDYERRGDTTPIDVVAVDELIAARARAREAGAWAEADYIREQLRAVFAVELDDRGRTWRAATILFDFDGDADALDPDFRATVDAILVRRAAAQRKRDFVVADALRDSLRREYDVEVHDRARYWRIIGRP